MVECVVEVLMFDFPEVKNHSIVFDLFTPWVNRYRILPGHGHMNRILPTWNEEEYFKFLTTQPTTCPVVLEARYSRADIDQLKRHTTGMEKFCGIGQMDIYENLVDLDEERIVQDVVFKDLTGKVVVGTARVMLHVTFWPDVREKLMCPNQRAASPAVQMLVSSLEVAHKPLSPTDAAAAVVADAVMGKYPRDPIYSYGYDDVTDHVNTSTQLDESPESPLTMRKQQTIVKVTKADEAVGADAAMDKYPSLGPWIPRSPIYSYDDVTDHVNTSISTTTKATQLDESPESPWTKRKQQTVFTVTEADCF